MNAKRELVKGIEEIMRGIVLDRNMSGEKIYLHHRLSDGHIEQLAQAIFDAGYTKKEEK